MLSCKDVSRLAASDGFEEAGWFRRLAIRMHLLMCGHCRRYHAQIRMIGRWARKHVLPEAPDPAARGDLKARILREIPGRESEA